VYCIGTLFASYGRDVQAGPPALPPGPVAHPLRRVEDAADDAPAEENAEPSAA
jgi:hypothetical protein